jgi:hypothetical protein
MMVLNMVVIFFLLLEAGSLLDFNEDDTRAANIFSHPRQPRSVRPRLRLSIHSDLE